MRTHAVCAPPQMCAFVTFTDRADAEKAAEEMQNKMLVKGTRLRLTWGRPQQQRPDQLEGGGGGGGARYGGGGAGGSSSSAPSTSAGRPQHSTGQVCPQHTLSVDMDVWRMVGVLWQHE